MRAVAIAALLGACSNSPSPEPTTTSAVSEAGPATQSAPTAPAPSADPPTGLKTVAFPSEDGVPITADLHAPHPDAAPFIVLFHQAGWSRGEYREIAPKLGALGFNTLAVDQRSGGKTEGIVNATHQAAKKAGKKTAFPDALQDMRAAVAWARTHHARGRLIVWGSSYSAALVLLLAADPKLDVDAALAFAPGEYFARFGKPTKWITSAVSKLDKPVFITSAANEKSKWAGIYAAIPSTSKRSFLPKTKGNHGSRALWDRFSDSEAYWTEVRSFLASVR